MLTDCSNSYDIFPKNAIKYNCKGISSFFFSSCAYTAAFFWICHCKNLLSLGFYSFF